MTKYKTEQRKKLIDFFQKNMHRSVSAQDIYDSLDSRDISMSAIYRNLSDMENDGQICRVNDSIRQGMFYQYMDPDHCFNVVHLKCKKCDATFHLNQHISQMMVGYAKEEYDFKINCTGAFLYGECEKCSDSFMNDCIKEN